MYSSSSNLLSASVLIYHTFETPEVLTDEARWGCILNVGGKRDGGVAEMKG